MPKSPVTLPLDDLQGLVTKAHGRRDGAVFFLLRVVNAERARRWIGRLPIPPASLRSADKGLDSDLVHLAISHAGLEALKLDDRLLSSWPRDFTQGPAHPDRARVLGDDGLDAASQWRFGSGECIVHLLLIAYARRASLPEVETRWSTEAVAEGCELVVPPTQTAGLPRSKEHFGFRDGIGQPLIRGVGFEGNQFNTVPGGEFLLGEEDAYGEITYAPKAQGDFAFGRNGSYFVLRQLEQDVHGFWSFLSGWAAKHPTGPDPIMLASKMVGRWPSGAPLVKYPEVDPDPRDALLLEEIHGEESRAENRRLRDAYRDDAFGYGQLDPDGLKCPFGAHIRRTNPRDWELAEERDESRTIANRHRILRRGRSYGPAFTETMHPRDMIERALQAPPDGIERGLMFCCLNANIERQFEFVQQQWANSPKFAGLETGADPLIGATPSADSGLRPSTFTIPASPTRHRVTGLPKFVRVRGTSYFFLPSLSALRWIAGR